MQSNTQYLLTAWTLLPANASCFTSGSGCVQATIKVSNAQGSVLSYLAVAFMNVGQLLAGQWNGIAGVFSLGAGDVAAGNSLLLYFEGPPPGTWLQLDDVALVQCQPPTWRQDAATRIEQVRAAILGLQ